MQARHTRCGWPALTGLTSGMYLAQLEQEGLSLNHRTRVKSTISNFAQFLIEEKGLLQRNPTRGIDLSPVPLLAPRQLSEEQRSILRSFGQASRRSTWGRPLRLGLLGGLPGERSLLAADG